MKKIKSYLLPVTVTIIILLLIVARNLGTSRFRYDAEKQAIKAYDRSNIVTPGNLDNLTKEATVIILDNNPSGSYLLKDGIKSVRIPADSVLDNKYLSIIRKSGHPVILFSHDEAISSRVWMVLAQTGFRNIYVWSASAKRDSVQK